MSGPIPVPTRPTQAEVDAKADTSSLGSAAFAATADFDAAGSATTAAAGAVTTAGAYTDTKVAEAIAGRTDKAPVRAVATTNQALTGPATFDGVTIVTNDRVLLAGQTTASQNGLYKTNTLGAWSRTTDADTSAEMVNGLAVSIQEGTDHANQLWVLTTEGTIVLGTTALTFAALSEQVQSVFGRKGAVTAQTGDYTPTQVGLGNVPNVTPVTRLTFSNADTTIVSTAFTTIVTQTGTLSAARIATLPSASAVPAGASVVVQAGLGASSTNTLSIARAGSDTINGGTTSFTIQVPYGWRRAISDGVSAWTIDAGIVRQSAFTAKGALLVGTAAGAASALAVGTDGFAVVADSTQTTGLGYAVVPWLRRVTLTTGDTPDTVVGTRAFTIASGIGGGYWGTALTNDQSWTFKDLPLSAGTWNADMYFQTDNSGGLATFSLTGLGAVGTIDCYNAVSGTASTLGQIIGFTIASDGRRDLVITNPTKNASSGNFRLRIQSITLRRTGP